MSGRISEESKRSCDCFSFCVILYSPCIYKKSEAEHNILWYNLCMLYACVNNTVLSLQLINSLLLIIQFILCTYLFANIAQENQNSEWFLEKTIFFPRLSAWEVTSNFFPRIFRNIKHKNKESYLWMVVQSWMLQKFYLNRSELTSLISTFCTEEYCKQGGFGLITLQSSCMGTAQWVVRFTWIGLLMQNMKTWTTESYYLCAVFSKDNFAG